MSKTCHWRKECSAHEQERGYLEWLPPSRRFTGTLRRATLDWVPKGLVEFEGRGRRQRLRPEHLCLYWIGRVTGERMIKSGQHTLV
jgi:hypothetical protein